MPWTDEEPQTNAKNAHVYATPLDFRAFQLRDKTYPLCNSERQLPRKASGGSAPKADLGLWRSDAF